MWRTKTKYFYVLVDQYKRYASLSDGGTFMFPTWRLESAYLFKSIREANKRIKLEHERVGIGNSEPIKLTKHRVAITVF